MILWAFSTLVVQYKTASPGAEQPNADERVARGRRENRTGGVSSGYAASLGQRKRVDHIPTAAADETETSGLKRFFLKSKSRKITP